MDESFASLLANPPTVRCMGLDMRPFSLGHYVLLMAEGSPFVVGGIPMYSDTVAAAAICAHSWQENQTLKRSWFRRWITMKLWAIVAGKFDVTEASVALMLHIRSSLKIPDAKEPKNGRYLFSSWEVRLLKFLRSIGFSQVEAMDYPLILANRLLVAHQEEEGQAEYVTKRNDKYTRALTREMEKLESGEITLTA